MTVNEIGKYQYYSYHPLLLVNCSKAETWALNYVIPNKLMSFTLFFIPGIGMPKITFFLFSQNLLYFYRHLPNSVWLKLAPLPSSIVVWQRKKKGAGSIRLLLNWALPNLFIYIMLNIWVCLYMNWIYSIAKQPLAPPNKNIYWIFIEVLQIFYLKKLENCCTCLTRS